jgi:hypothetical protein
MRGGARPRYDSPTRSGRRPLGPAGAVALLAAALLLTACADPTGEIDEDGHNGYDAMSCEKGKSLALDMQYGAMNAPSVRERMEDLSAAAKKAGHDDVREAATALLLGYRAKDPAKVTAASRALVKACAM